MTDEDPESLPSEGFRDRIRNLLYPDGEPAPGRGRLYFTFGTQYARELHPAGAWVHPDGYLTVDYPLDALPTSDVIAHTDEPWKAMKHDARERARMAIWQWLEGHYAFEYDEVPDPQWTPRGELARVVLP